MSTRVRTHMDTLRALATANDLNQVILVEQCIDDYLKANGGRLPCARKAPQCDP
jgi:hypothetical protein